MEFVRDLDTFCALLQSNDPNTTKVLKSYIRFHTLDYGRIGKALQGNTHVADLCIYMRLLLDSSLIYQENTFVRRIGTVNENELLTRGEKWAELVLQYISSSTVLRKLSLKGEGNMGGMNELEYRVVSKLAGLFFQAVASSSSIEQLEIDRWLYMEVSHESFGLVLQQTRSLRQLQIPLPDHDTTARDVEWLGCAFRSNSSLEALVIDNDKVESPMHCAVLKEILSSLCSHPKIQDLCLRYRGEIAIETAEDLCRFLGATSTLNRLDIDYSYITVEAMQHLIDGLRSNRGTIQRLGLPKYAMLPLDASEAFVAFLSSTTTTSSNGLSELRYKNTNELDALAESLLILDSVGSGLRHLELGFDSSPFLNALSTHVSRSKLESLQICFNDRTADSLWRCVPALVHLRELRVSLAAYGRYTVAIFRRIFPRLVEALKKNGSLFKVTFPIRFGDPEPDPPGCRKRRYLDALGQRNQKVPRMLSRPRIEHEAQQEDSANDLTDIKQFPALFAAALDAEQMSPNTFLIGLVSSQDEVGHHNHGEKRSSRAT